MAGPDFLSKPESLAPNAAGTSTLRACAAAGAMSAAARRRGTKRTMALTLRVRAGGRRRSRGGFGVGLILRGMAVSPGGGSGWHRGEANWVRRPGGRVRPGAARDPG